MKKITYIILKSIFSLLLLTPIVSSIGLLFGADIAPKAEYYNTPEAFAFIQMLMDSMYINIIISLVFAIGLILLWTKRAALAAVLIFPITVNIFCFHAFLDGGLLTGGAIMGNALMALNLYLFWYHWKQYKTLLSRDLS